MSYFVTKYLLFQSPKQILAKVNREAWVDKDDPPEVTYEEDRFVMQVGHNSVEEEKKLLQKGKEDNITMVEVSVRIWFTKKFAAMEEDIQGYIDTCFEEANGALANSLVPMRLKHHGTKFYEGDELYEGNAMLNAFMSDAYKNSTTRDYILNTADAAIILVSKSRNLCGMAFANTARIPYGFVAHGCARYDGTRSGPNRVVADMGEMENLIFVDL